MSVRSFSTGAALAARATVLAALTVCALGACYSYRAVPIEQVSVGTPVRVRISPTEAARVGSILGREDRVLDGQLLATESDNSVMVAVSTAPMDATGVGPLHQRIAIPREGLVEVEVRRLDKVKTAGVIAVAGAAAAAVTIAAFGGVNVRSGGSKGGTDNLRMPNRPGVVLLRLTP